MTASVPAWQKFHGGNRRPHGGNVTRFVGTASHASREEAALHASHAALVNATTLFPSSVVTASASPRLLVSGHNSAKLGRIVLKGAWRGMPIYLLTLVERETCPTSCSLLAECFGNAMPFARRHRYTPDLVARLDDELRAKAVEHRAGFVVRLHNLGDFPDADYATAWLRWLSQLPQLHVFGYTAHPADGEIGRIVNLAGAFHPDRWMIRFSVAPDNDPLPMQATTIWRQPEASTVPEGLTCPAQTHRTQACATCGLCWTPAAAAKRIVFIGHGRRLGGRKPLSQEDGDMSWADDPDRVERARKFWDEGLSTAEIGRRIGVTKSAIIGVAHRRGWQERPSPIKPRTGEAPPEKPRRVHGPTLPPLIAAEPAPAPETRYTISGRITPFRIDDAKRPAIRGATLAATVQVKAALPPALPPSPFKTCQFALNNGRPWLFCEAPTEPGSAYCPEHHAICYTKHGGSWYGDPRAAA